MVYVESVSTSRDLLVYFSPSVKATTWPNGKLLFTFFAGCTSMPSQILPCKVRRLSSLDLIVVCTNSTKSYLPAAASMALLWWGSGCICGENKQTNGQELNKQLWQSWSNHQHGSTTTKSEVIISVSIFCFRGILSDFFHPHTWTDYCLKIK